MKRIVPSLVVLITILVAETTEAQDGYQLETLLVSSGSDPITSGVAGIAHFRRSDGRFAEIAVQSEQAWVSYGQYFERGDLTLVAGGAVGHFQTAPLMGLRLDASLRVTERVRLDALYWPGLLLEEPEDWKTENRRGGKPGKHLSRAVRRYASCDRTRSTELLCAEFPGRTLERVARSQLLVALSRRSDSLLERHLEQQQRGLVALDRTGLEPLSGPD